MIGKLFYFLWPITVVAALTTTLPFIPIVSSFGLTPRSSSSSTPSFRVVIYPHPLYNRHNLHHRPLFRPTATFLVKVDPYRDPNQIRPSLHPITINIIAQALKLRASTHATSRSRSRSTPPHPHNRTTDTQMNNTGSDVGWPTQPLDVVLTVSALAQTALAQRQQSSREDQMTLTLLEQQTIAGRVVGVMVRIHDLEECLFQKCANVSYIAKYDEWYAYGLRPPTRTTENGQADNSTNNIQQQQQQQLSFDNHDIDPLLLLNRAECCLALFLQVVEIPELQRKNATVPDASRIDFLDADRYQVLVSSVTSS